MDWVCATDGSSLPATKLKLDLQWQRRRESYACCQMVNFELSSFYFWLCVAILEQYVVTSHNSPVDTTTTKFPVREHSLLLLTGRYSSFTHGFVS